jgi:hypothetical protein
LGWRSVIFITSSDLDSFEAADSFADHAGRTPL